MGLRCKVFREKSSGILELQINDWLESNEDITIAHITHSEDDQYWNVIIFYTRKLDMLTVKKDG